jgi:Zn-dependent M28 family amino/carboxypeptidase
VTQSATSPPQVNRQRLWQTLEAIAYERFSPDQRQQARTELQSQLELAGWRVQQQLFQNSGLSGINLVAERPGLNPRAGTLIIGAHYDTVAGSPGADDNGSAVATLVELAHLFSPKTFPAQQRGLRFVLFDLEEPGLMGSFAYASNSANLDQVVGVIVLEMLGYTCKTPGCQKVPANLQVQLPSPVGDFIAIVGDTEHLPLLQSFQAAFPGKPAILPVPIPFKGALTPDVLRSDHAPFWQMDVGAVMVTDTANFRNPHYHKASDTLATLDPDFLTATAQLIANTAQMLLASSKPLVSSSTVNP